MTQLYVAMARRNDADEFEPVTLLGELFLANKGLIELCVEKSREKHPDWQYQIREVGNA